MNDKKKVTKKHVFGILRCEYAALTKCNLCHLEVTEQQAKEKKNEECQGFCDECW